MIQPRSTANLQMNSHPSSVQRVSPEDHPSQHYHHPSNFSSPFPNLPNSPPSSQPLLVPIEPPLALFHSPSSSARLFHPYAAPHSFSSSSTNGNHYHRPSSLPNHNLSSAATSPFPASPLPSSPSSLLLSSLRPSSLRRPHLVLPLSDSGLWNVRDPLNPPSIRPHRVGNRVVVAASVPGEERKKETDIEMEKRWMEWKEERERVRDKIAKMRKIQQQLLLQQRQQDKLQKQSSQPSLPPSLHPSDSRLVLVESEGLTSDETPGFIKEQQERLFLFLLEHWKHLHTTPLEHQPVRHSLQHQKQIEQEQEEMQKMKQNEKQQQLQQTNLNASSTTEPTTSSSSSPSPSSSSPSASTPSSVSSPSSPTLSSSNRLHSLLQHSRHSLTFLDAQTLYSTSLAGSDTTLYLNEFLSSSKRFASFEELIEAVREAHVKWGKRKKRAYENQMKRNSKYLQKALSWLQSGKCRLFSPREGEMSAKEVEKKVAAIVNSNEIEGEKENGIQPSSSSSLPLPPSSSSFSPPSSTRHSRLRIRATVLDACTLIVFAGGLDRCLFLLKLWNDENSASKRRFVSFSELLFAVVRWNKERKERERRKKELEKYLYSEKGRTIFNFQPPTESTKPHHQSSSSLPPPSSSSSSGPLLSESALSRLHSSSLQSDTCLLLLQLYTIEEKPFHSLDELLLELKKDREGLEKGIGEIWVNGKEKVGDREGFIVLSGAGAGRDTWKHLDEIRNELEEQERLQREQRKGIEEEKEKKENGDGEEGERKKSLMVRYDDINEIAELVHERHQQLLQLRQVFYEWMQTNYNSIFIHLNPTSPRPSLNEWEINQVLSALDNDTDVLLYVKVLRDRLKQQKEQQQEQRGKQGSTQKKKMEKGTLLIVETMEQFEQSLLQIQQQYQRLREQNRSAIREYLLKDSCQLFNRPPPSAHTRSLPSTTTATNSLPLLTSSSLDLLLHSTTSSSSPSSPSLPLLLYHLHLLQQLALSSPLHRFTSIPALASGVKKSIERMKQLEKEVEVVMKYCKGMEKMREEKEEQESKDKKEEEENGKGIVTGSGSSSERVLYHSLQAGIEAEELLPCLWQLASVNRYEPIKYESVGAIVKGLKTVKKERKQQMKEQRERVKKLIQLIIAQQHSLSHQRHHHSHHQQQNELELNDFSSIEVSVEVVEGVLTAGLNDVVEHLQYLLSIRHCFTNADQLISAVRTARSQTQQQMNEIKTLLYQRDQQQQQQVEQHTDVSTMQWIKQISKEDLEFIYFQSHAYNYTIIHLRTLASSSSSSSSPSSTWSSLSSLTYAVYQLHQTLLSQATQLYHTLQSSPLFSSSSSSTLFLFPSLLPLFSLLSSHSFSTIDSLLRRFIHMNRRFGSGEDWLEAIYAALKGRERKQQTQIKEVRERMQELIEKGILVNEEEAKKLYHNIQPNSSITPFLLHTIASRSQHPFTEIAALIEAVQSCNVAHNQMIETIHKLLVTHRQLLFESNRGDKKGKDAAEGGMMINKEDVSEMIENVNADKYILRYLWQLLQQYENNEEKEEKERMKFTSLHQLTTALSTTHQSQYIQIRTEIVALLSTPPSLLLPSNVVVGEKEVDYIFSSVPAGMPAHTLFHLQLLHLQQQQQQQSLASSSSPLYDSLSSLISSLTQLHSSSSALLTEATTFLNSTLSSSSSSSSLRVNRSDTIQLYYTSHAGPDLLYYVRYWSEKQLKEGREKTIGIEMKKKLMKEVGPHVKELNEVQKQLYPLVLQAVVAHPVEWKWVMGLIQSLELAQLDSEMIVKVMKEILTEQAESGKKCETAEELKEKMMGRVHTQRQYQQEQMEQIRTYLVHPEHQLLSSEAIHSLTNEHLLTILNTTSSSSPPSSSTALDLLQSFRADYLSFSSPSLLLSHFSSLISQQQQQRQLVFNYLLSNESELIHEETKRKIRENKEEGQRKGLEEVNKIEKETGVGKEMLAHCVEFERRRKKAVKEKNTTGFPVAEIKDLYLAVASSHSLWSSTRSSVIHSLQSFLSSSDCNIFPSSSPSSSSSSPPSFHLPFQVNRVGLSEWHQLYHAGHQYKLKQEEDIPHGLATASSSSLMHVQHLHQQVHNHSLSPFNSLKELISAVQDLHLTTVNALYNRLNELQSDLFVPQMNVKEEIELGDMDRLLVETELQYETSQYLDKLAQSITTKCSSLDQLIGQIRSLHQADQEGNQKRVNSIHSTLLSFQPDLFSSQIELSLSDSSLLSSTFSSLSLPLLSYLLFLLSTSRLKSSSFSHLLQLLSQRLLSFQEDVERVRKYVVGEEKEEEERGNRMRLEIGEEVREKVRKEKRLVEELIVKVGGKGGGEEIVGFIKEIEEQEEKEKEKKKRWERWEEIVEAIQNQFNHKKKIENSKCDQLRSWFTTKTSAPSSSSSSSLASTWTNTHFDWLLSLTNQTPSHLIAHLSHLSDSSSSISIAQYSDELYEAVEKEEKKTQESKEEIVELMNEQERKRGGKVVFGKTEVERLYKEVGIHIAPVLLRRYLSSSSSSSSSPLSLPSLLSSLKNSTTHLLTTLLSPSFHLLPSRLIRELTAEDAGRVLTMGTEGDEQGCIAAIEWLEEEMERGEVEGKRSGEGGRMQEVRYESVSELVTGVREVYEGMKRIQFDVFESLTSSESNLLNPSLKSSLTSEHVVQLMWFTKSSVHLLRFIQTLYSSSATFDSLIQLQDALVRVREADIEQHQKSVRTIRDYLLSLECELLGGPIRLRAKEREVAQLLVAFRRSAPRAADSELLDVLRGLNVGRVKYERVIPELRDSVVEAARKVVPTTDSLTV